MLRVSTVSMCKAGSRMVFIIYELRYTGINYVANLFVLKSLGVQINGVSSILRARFRPFFILGLFIHVSLAFSIVSLNKNKLELIKLKSRIFSFFLLEENITFHF